MFLHSLLMQRQKHPQKRQARICTLYLSLSCIHVLHHVVSELSDSTRIIRTFKLFMILEDLDRWFPTFQEIMVWQSDGGHNSMEICSKTYSSKVWRDYSQLQQIKAQKMHLSEGGFFAHSSLSLCSNLFLQWGVASWSLAAKKLQLFKIKAIRGTTREECHKHENIQWRPESVQGEVIDRWHDDEKVCGGRGSHDAAEEEEPNGVHQEEEYHEEETDWTQSSQ